jgi:hypothetical protein
MTKMLLIQDDLRVGRSLIRLLEAYGYEDKITWIAGVTSLDIEDGILHGLDIRECETPVKLKDHVIVFLDGHLKIGIASGMQIAQSLGEGRLVRIAMSTMYNDKIEADHKIEPGSFKEFIETKLSAIYAAACAQRSPAA